MSEVDALPAYRRPHYVELLPRLKEPRHFLQVVAGPRQVGKTTLVQQVLAALSVPVIYASADEPTLKGPEWVAVQWERAVWLPWINILGANDTFSTRRLYSFSS